MSFTLSPSQPDLLRHRRLPFSGDMLRSGNSDANLSDMSSENLVFLRRSLAAFVFFAVIFFVFNSLYSFYFFVDTSFDSRSSSLSFFPFFNDNFYQGSEEYKLDRVLNAAANKDKTVILTTLNEAWAMPNSIIDLFLESFRIGHQTRELLNHLVIVALDDKAFRRCVSLHRHCYALLNEGMDFSKEAYFMTPDYLKMMWRRIGFLRSVLEMGYNFIFTILYPMGVFGHECTLERVIDEMKGYSDFSIHQLLYNYGIDFKDAKGILPEDQVLKSAKCQALARILPSLKRDGHRVLIFSQWTSMLDILEWALDVIGVTYRRLDGSTQVAVRQTIVDTFNNDTSIFACLLSTRAGGQGLNLTGADTVIIHDMDFNPQIDRQAEDRCHRIGQTKPVTIYRLVTKDTVDEEVYKIAQRKIVLDAAVLESDKVVMDNGDAPEKTMGEILSAMLLR